MWPGPEGKGAEGTLFARMPACRHVAYPHGPLLIPDPTGGCSSGKPTSLADAVIVCPWWRLGGWERDERGTSPDSHHPARSWDDAGTPALWPVATHHHRLHQAKRAPLPAIWGPTRFDMLVTLWLGWIRELVGARRREPRARWPSSWLFHLGCEMSRRRRWRQRAG